MLSFLPSHSPNHYRSAKSSLEWMSYRFSDTLRSKRHRYVPQNYKCPRHSVWIYRAKAIFQVRLGRSPSVGLTKNIQFIYVYVHLRDEECVYVCEWCTSMRNQNQIVPINYKWNVEMCACLDIIFFCRVPYMSDTDESEWKSGRMSERILVDKLRHFYAVNIVSVVVIYEIMVWMLNKWFFLWYYNCHIFINLTQKFYFNFQNFPFTQFPSHESHIKKSPYMTQLSIFCSFTLRSHNIAHISLLSHWAYKKISIPVVIIWLYYFCFQHNLPQFLSSPILYVSYMFYLLHNFMYLESLEWIAPSCHHQLP